MRSQFASLRTLVLPFGAITGTRIVLDGTTGTIQFYDQSNNLVGLLSPDQWYTGITGQAQATLDPFGGFRVYDSSGDLAGIFSAAGLQTLLPGTDAAATLSPTNLLLSDLLGNTIQLGQVAGTPFVPGFTSSSALLPGTTIDTPLLTLVSGPQYLLVRHAAAFEDNPSSGRTWTSPAGYTERSDTTDGTSSSTLSTTVATNDAETTAPLATFTSTSSAWEMDTGFTVGVRGTNTTTPTFRAISTGAFTTTSGTSATLTLGPPAGTALNDVLLAFVSYGCDGLDSSGAPLPVSWSVPTGWVFLGAAFNTTGTGAAASTIATGCWYKVATASEPASYTVDVVLAGTGEKKLQATVVGCQSAALRGGGPSLEFSDSTSQVVIGGSTSTARLSVQAASGQNILSARIDGDTSSRLLVGIDGVLSWGSGSAAGDVNLNRTAAETLQISSTGNLADLEVEGPSSNFNSLARGLVAAPFDSTSNNGAHSSTTTTDMVINNVPLVAGRWYEVHIHTQVSLSGTGVWLLELYINGSQYDRLCRIDQVNPVFTADVKTYFVAITSQSTDDFAIQATESSGTATLTLVGAAGVHRWMTIKDIGS